jgi:hypothetical protein
MSEWKELLNAQFELADAIKRYSVGWISNEEMALELICAALYDALGADAFRMLQYIIQRENAPADPIEEEWVEARRAEIRAKDYEFEYEPEEYLTETEMRELHKACDELKQRMHDAGAPAWQDDRRNTQGSD